MLEVLYPPSLKEMSNYLEDEWLSAEQSHYPSYPPPVQQPTTSAEVQGLSYNNAPYQPPKSVPVSFSQSMPSFVYSGGPMTQSSFDGLELLGGPVYPSYHSPVPRSTVSSPSLSAQPGVVEDLRGQPFGSPVPQQTSQPPHPMLSRSPVLNRSVSARLLPSQSPIPPTPRSSHVLSTQSVLAPQPTNVQQSRPLKRSREDSDTYDSSMHPSQRRRSRSGSLIPRLQTELSEEEQLLLKLKHEESLPWKDIAREFEVRLNRTYQVPALQMRYKRLRERLRTWSDDDVQALKAAHEYWEKSKFEIISQKMLDFGAAEKWPAKICERKWDELRPSMSETVQPEDATGNIPLIPVRTPPPIDEPLTRSSPDITRTPQTNRWPYTTTTATATLSEKGDLKYSRHDD